MRTILAFIFSILTVALAAQSVRKAAACFWSNDFEAGIPVDWEITQVERQTPEGVGLGEFVPAFTLGDAADANAGGYFPVADMPIGNQFIMANDDAEPCNCSMSDVSLTTGPIDLSSREWTSLEFRAFHEKTLGAGDAIVEATTNGSDWTVLDTLDAVVGAWQDVFLDISAYDLAPLFKLRFRWSDGGGWSSGFALDDICLRERSDTDVSLIETGLFEIAGDPFNTSSNTLRYTELPLEQTRPLFVSTVIMNRGVANVLGIGFDAEVFLNGVSQGTFSTEAVLELAPGERDTITLATGWTATSTGTIEVNVTATLSGVDEDPADNEATATMRITGPGWENGYGAMACDEGMMQGTIGGSNNFIAANRMEIINEGSTARGVSAVIAGNSQLGEKVRAILMDANFAFIDTSLSHVLTEADLNAGWVGEALYLPFSETPELTSGDYHVGLQRLTGTGDVFVATSGTGPMGAAVLMQGPTFDISYLSATPMVRLHLEDYGVGLAEFGSVPAGLRVFPVPANESVILDLTLEEPAAVRLEVFDTMGRMVLSGDRGVLPAGMHTQQLTVGTLEPGGYTVHVVTPGARSTKALIIAR